MKTARDVMTPNLLLVAATASVAQASVQMQRHHTHSLLVERASEVDAYGIITDTDVVVKVIAQGKDPAQTKVQEVMSKPIITIPPECTLAEIAQLMARSHVNHLPVFDGKKLIGMVSSTDIFNVK
jgi:CBS domain-containing protein